MLKRTGNCWIRTCYSTLIFRINQLNLHEFTLHYILVLSLIVELEVTILFWHTLRPTENLSKDCISAKTGTETHRIKTLEGNLDQLTYQLTLL